MLAERAHKGIVRVPDPGDGRAKLESVAIAQQLVPELDDRLVGLLGPDRVQALRADLDAIRRQAPSVRPGRARSRSSVADPRHARPTSRVSLRATMSWEVSDENGVTVVELTEDAARGTVVAQLRDAQAPCGGGATAPSPPHVERAGQALSTPEALMTARRTRPLRAGH